MWVDLFIFKFCCQVVCQSFCVLKGVLTEGFFSPSFSPAMKSKLSTITSVHVYSIQKALLKDSSPLYNTDYDIVKSNLQHCSK